MLNLRAHAALALLTVLLALCLLAGFAATVVVDGVLGAPAAVLCAAATFQALRAPVGRTAGRLLER